MIWYHGSKIRGRITQFCRSTPNERIYPSKSCLPSRGATKERDLTGDPKSWHHPLPKRNVSSVRTTYVFTRRKSRDVTNYHPKSWKKDTFVLSPDVLCPSTAFNTNPVCKVWLTETVLCNVSSQSDWEHQTSAPSTWSSRTKGSTERSKVYNNTGR